MPLSLSGLQGVYSVLYCCPMSLSLQCPHGSLHTHAALGSSVLAITAHHLRPRSSTRWPMTGADSWQAHHVGFFDLPSELWMNVAAARLDFQCRRPPLAVRLFPYVYLDHSLVSSTALQCLRRKVFCVVPGPGQSEGRWGYGEVSVTPPPPRLIPPPPTSSDGSPRSCLLSESSPYKV